MESTYSIARTAARNRLLLVLAQSSIFVAILLLCAAALLLLTRRLSNALTQPLDALTLASAGLLMAAAAWAVLAAWHAIPTGPARSWAAHAIFWIPAAALLLLAGSLSLPNSPTAGIVLLWAVLVTSEACLWQWHSRHSVAAAPGEARTALRLPDPHVPVEPEVPCQPHDIIQELTRATDADGNDRLAGSLGSTLERGQRSAVMHVAFCPPFATTPRMEIEQSEGPEARVKLAEVLPYGARIELRLLQAPTQPTRVAVQFHATLP